LFFREERLKDGCLSFLQTELFWFAGSMFAAPVASFRQFRHEVGPEELDYPRIVVAVRKIVIQSRKTLLLMNFLHAGQLAIVVFVLIILPQSQVETYMGKHGATVPSVPMMTLLWSARQAPDGRACSRL
jgi:hypothetical protein